MLDTKSKSGLITDFHALGLYIPKGGKAALVMKSENGFREPPVITKEIKRKARESGTASIASRSRLMKSRVVRPDFCRSLDFR
jgi:hypothetical protein